MSAEVRSLVLSAPVGFGRLPLAELAARPIAKELAISLLPRIVSRPPLLTALYSHFVTNGTPPTPDLCRRLAVEAGGVAPGLRAALEALGAASRRAGPFTRGRLDYHGPVVAVWGDHDSLVPPSHARGVSLALPQASIHLWTGVGHHLQRERPLALGALVEAACRVRAQSVGSKRDLRLVA
jgi:pimeloyl-ACP methyl ester carboxylesterase